MGALIRLLVLAAIVWLVVGALRRVLAGPSPKTGMEPPQAMHACAHCGLHVPDTECTRHQGRYFCSDAHRDAWLRKGT